MMKTANNSLLVKFQSRDTPFGVTRATVRAIAKELGINETQVVHIALSRFATDVLPAYAPDDAPLTAKEVLALRKDAAKRLPKGKVLLRDALFG
jgi:hypothetical protein